MSHRWQKQQPGRRSPRRRQRLRPSGLCLGLLPQRRLEKREGWLPSFLYAADKRVCRNVHERSSSPTLLLVIQTKHASVTCSEGPKKFRRECHAPGCREGGAVILWNLRSVPSVQTLEACVSVAEPVIYR